MLKLFEPKPVPSAGALKPNNSYQLEVRSESIIRTLSAYYESSSFRLPNDHLILQILKNLQFSLETPFERVVDTVYTRAPNVARHFNLTSQISYGKPHRKVFYSSANNDVVDYIFSNNIADINPFDEHKPWIMDAPIKVIHHPCTDLRFLPINGEVRVPWKGYSVVHIDIPLLAIQYWEWSRRRYAHFGSEAIVNPNKFLVTNVFPKMYRSHVDYVMFNKMRIRAGLMENVNHNQWLPIALPDMEKLADSAVEELFPKLQRGRTAYVNTLERFPVVFAKNGLEAAQLPIFVATRQLNWLQILSRIPLIETLVTLQGRQGREANKPYLKQFNVDASYFVNAREFEYIQPKEEQQRVLEFIERVKNY